MSLADTLQIPLQDLASSRIQLHYAIQCIAAIGMALGEAQPDGGQGTLKWNAEIQGFVGQMLPKTEIRVALIPATLTSVIFQRRDPVATRSLVGQTMAAILDWHKTELTQLGIDTSGVKLLDYPPDDFPDHPLAQGATFEAVNGAALQAIATYYDQTRPLLAQIVATHPTASPIRIWPHHFDMATLLTYPGATDADTRYLGVGLSPGDTSYAEPYWYITPYPHPDIAALPDLPVGAWHTDHWVGAVLTASEVMDETTLPAFITTAVAASKTLLSVES